MEVVRPSVRAAVLKMGRRVGWVQSWGAAVMTPFLFKRGMEV